MNEKEREGKEAELVRTREMSYNDAHLFDVRCYTYYSLRSCNTLDGSKISLANGIIFVTYFAASLR